MRTIRPTAEGNEAGTASELFEWPAADLTQDEWRQVVCHSLRHELQDPREDVYSLEDGLAAQ